MIRSGRGANITRAMCFPGGETKKHWECVSEVGEHISPGICVSQLGELISLGIWVSGVREHISQRICATPPGKHVSKGICVSQVGERYH